MRRRGFTLIELLATISVMALIGLLIVPVVTRTLNKQRRNLYDVQVQTIIKAGEGWATKNINLLPEGNVQTIYVGMTLLAQGGFLEQNDVMDPRTDEAITGCVAVTFDNLNNQYAYSFINTSNGASDECLTDNFCVKFLSGDIGCKCDKNASGDFECEDI